MINKMIKEKVKVLDLLVSEFIESLSKDTGRIEVINSKFIPSNSHLDRVYFNMITFQIKTDIKFIARFISSLELLLSIGNKQFLKFGQIKFDFDSVLNRMEDKGLGLDDLIYLH